MSMMSDSDLGAVAGNPGVEPPSPGAAVDDPNLSMRWAAAGARVPAYSVRRRSSRPMAPYCSTG